MTILLKVMPFAQAMHFTHANASAWTVELAIPKSESPVPIWVSDGIFAKIQPIHALFELSAAEFRFEEEESI